jgi:hypothetical protein
LVSTIQTDPSPTATAGTRPPTRKVPVTLLVARHRRPGCGLVTHRWQDRLRERRDGNDEIYTMRADGSRQVNRTQHSGFDIQPDWQASGGLD